jgi:hypothetical protein
MFLRHLLRAFHPTEPATPRRAAPDRSQCAAASRMAPKPLQARGPRLYPGKPRTARAERSPLFAREESFRARTGLLIWPCRSRLPRKTQGDFSTCSKYTTRDRQIYFPSEGRHAQDFLRPEKIRRFRPGLNPRSWVPEASMLTTRPPKPLRRG